MNVNPFFNQHCYDTNAQWFTALKKAHLTHYNDYLIFNISGQLDQPFLNSCLFLASQTTLSLKEAKTYLTEGFLVAQSIDGDYIVALSNKTLVIPVDLHRNDIEVFPFTIAQFMAKLNNQTLQSRYIAIN